MYSVGLLVFLTACLPETTAFKIALAVPSTVFLLWFSQLISQNGEDDEPVTLPKCPLSVIFPFFRARFDFLSQGFQLTGQSVYKFKLLQKTVVVLSGAPARREFFLSRDLDLSSGFKALSGAIPILPGVTTDLGGRQTALIYKRLASVQNSDRLSQLIPKILDDACEIMQSWGQSGIIDSFRQIPQLTFQTNVRSLAPTELADDSKLVARLKQLYDTLDSAITPISVLFPWIPSPSTIKRLFATKDIFGIISTIVDARVQSAIPGDDTLQLLLDNGDDRMIVIGFIMGLLIAGARSTGATASWLVTFLAGHPQWKERAALELKHLLLRYSSESDGAASTDSQPSPSCLAKLSADLASIPLEAWETQTPVLDALIRETLRLAEPHTAMRMNVGPEVQIAGKNVPPGAFVVYPFSDVHLNAELYPDPWKFDPARPESNMPFSYVGWGAGKNLCLGQRLAKLQLKLITALIVLGFEITATDDAGKPLAALPRPDWNDTLACKPAEGSCYLRYERKCSQKF